MTEQPKINVTKTFLPPIDEYREYLEKIWENNQVTNQGPLLKEFEHRISTYLEIENFHFVGNGTQALQIALQALDIDGGEVITTPFSYVATLSSILWQKCTPVFVDIDRDSLCINSGKIESAITKHTKAILPVHVFGNACNISEIEDIAKKHNIKTIYDGAHAFGANYQGKSLLDYGDISISSFHATKPFHTIEGGGVVVKNKLISEKIELVKRFGHQGDEHFMLGINAKANEFEAAMGLCNLKYIDDITESRRKITVLYDELIDGKYQTPKYNKNLSRNYSYYPIIFDSQIQLLRTITKLNTKNIFPRRYFYPALNTLPYVKGQKCPVAEDISNRILCLPIYHGLEERKVKVICEVL